MRLLLLMVAAAAWGAESPLEPGDELTVDSPWSEPVVLAVGAGNYRLEATTLAGDPVEFVVEARAATAWTPVATNRTALGVLEAGVDWTASVGEWRARRAQAGRGTVVLRLQKTLFTPLKNALLQTLSAGPATVLPLTLREEYPAATAPAVDPSGTVTNAWGTFRTTNRPVAVFRLAAAGWENLALPLEAAADRIVLGSTADAVYALVASSTSAHRAFYSWTPRGGWVAGEAPRADGPPAPGLWSASEGAGALFVVEGRGTTLTLWSFDGTEWRPPLDLSVLAARGLKRVALTSPSPAARTGTLVVTTDRVSVYDLP